MSYEWIAPVVVLSVVGVDVDVVVLVLVLVDVLVLVLVLAKSDVEVGTVVQHRQAVELLGRMVSKRPQ